jgi:pimeloyl-ACP methyl ester carboxylesterase
MAKGVRGGVAVGVFVAMLLAAAPAGAGPVPGACIDGVLPHGALSRICVPSSGWNGSLVVYAHGYAAVTETIDFKNLTLPDGTDLPTLVQQLGFAFATTSCRKNGLAILECSLDTLELVDAAPGVLGSTPQHTYLAGVSEGGLVTAILAERAPSKFTAALSTCGPIGSFRGQITYMGDFRALFDVYFPGLIPGSAISIPDNVIQMWDSYYEPLVDAAVRADLPRAQQLLKVGRVSSDLTNVDTVAHAVTGLLWYNVFGTNDATVELGGNPYDNRSRYYTGSANDAILNLLVTRYTASQTAVNAMTLYETSGHLTIPMVTLHTTGDEIIPFSHEVLYKAKSQLSGRGKLAVIPLYRDGHCSFTSSEVVSAFVLMLLL